MRAECLDLPELCVSKAHLDSLRVLDHLRESLVEDCGRIGHVGVSKTPLA